MSSTRSPVTAGSRPACAAISGGASPIHCSYHSANSSYRASACATLPTLTGLARMAACRWPDPRGSRLRVEGEMEACAVLIGFRLPPRLTGGRERGYEQRTAHPDAPSGAQIAGLRAYGERWKREREAALSAAAAEPPSEKRHLCGCGASRGDVPLPLI